LSSMDTLVAVKTAVHPESHSWPMEMSGPAVSWGKMCALRAAGGREGISKSASCVEDMVLPSGSMTVIPGEARRWLTKCVSGVKKWPVLPRPSPPTTAQDGPSNTQVFSHRLGWLFTTSFSCYSSPVGCLRKSDVGQLLYSDHGAKLHYPVSPDGSFRITSLCS
jgi:hypothetical protein